jgi:hypothetical protein
MVIALPTNTATQAGMYDGSTAKTLNMGFEWSVINTGTGVVNIDTNTNHSFWGDQVIDANKSGRFYTKIGGSNIAYTYRLA